jgi:hypothetical protein
MNVTHHLRIHHRDNDCCSIECLCTRESAITIILAMLKSRPGERFYITLHDLFNGKFEEIQGFSLKQDGQFGQCYYYMSDEEFKKSLTKTEGV